MTSRRLSGYKKNSIGLKVGGGALANTSGWQNDVTGLNQWEDNEHD